MNRHWDGELPGAAVPVCAAVTGTVPVPPRRHGPGARRTVTVYGTIMIFSLVWESRGSPELWYASTRKPRGAKKGTFFHVGPH